MPLTKEASFAETVEQRLGNLKNRTAKVGVIGLGYVGLPLSLLFAEAGFAVTGFDIDEKKVTDLEAGRSYIFRIPTRGDSKRTRTWIPRDRRFLEARIDGRDHHVRPDAADGASRAGSELH